MLDLSNLSLAELRNLQTRVAEQIGLRNEQEKKAAREQIIAIAQSVGVPLKELIGKGNIKAARAQIRFRNPENQRQEWTGRGRQPRWIKEWVGAGKSLDKLRVG